MKPVEMISVTKAAEGETYTVVMGSLFAACLGPDEALACVAQALFGEKSDRPHFLRDAENQIAWGERELAKPRHDASESRIDLGPGSQIHFWSLRNGVTFFGPDGCVSGNVLIRLQMQDDKSMKWMDIGSEIGPYVRWRIRFQAKGDT